MNNDEPAQLSLLSPDFRVNEYQGSTGGVNNLNQVLSPDPTRWAVVFGFVAGAGSISVSTVNNGTATIGLKINASLPPVGFTFRDYGALVQGSWYLISSTAGQQYQILEVLYRPATLQQSEPEALANAVAPYVEVNR